MAESEQTPKNHELAEHQVHEVKKVVTLVEEIRQGLASTVMMSHRSQELSSSVVMFTEKANDTVQKLHHSVSNLFNAIGRVKGITQGIKSIEDKTHTINDIVNETEILAINASMEAGRAGAHGFAFGVIAERVRELSETTGATAKEIQSIITEFQSFVEETLNEIHRKTEDSRTDLRVAVQNFEKIAEDVNVLADVSNKSYMESNSQLQKVATTKDLLNAQVAGFSTTVDEIVSLFTASDVIELAPETVYKSRSKYQVIDVRESGEVSQVKLDDSQVITLNDKFASHILEHDRAAHYLFVCQNGALSSRAAACAKVLGFTNVFYLEGGLDKWVACNLPIKSNDKEISKASKAG